MDDLVVALERLTVGPAAPPLPLPEPLSPSSTTPPAAAAAAAVGWAGGGVGAGGGGATPLRSALRTPGAAPRLASRGSALRFSAARVVEFGRTVRGLGRQRRVMRNRVWVWPGAFCARAIAG